MNQNKNQPGTYVLVTKEGKIITKFRLRVTADQMKPKYEDKLFEELEIKKVK